MKTAVATDRRKETRTVENRRAPVGQVRLGAKDTSSEVGRWAAMLVYHNLRTANHDFDDLMLRERDFDGYGLHETNIRKILDDAMPGYLDHMNLLIGQQPAFIQGTTKTMEQRVYRCIFGMYRDGRDTTGDTGKRFRISDKHPSRNLRNEKILEAVQRWTLRRGKNEILFFDRMNFSKAPFPVAK